MQLLRHLNVYAHLSIAPERELDDGPVSSLHPPKTQKFLEPPGTDLRDKSTIVFGTESQRSRYIPFLLVVTDRNADLLASQLDSAFSDGSYVVELCNCEAGESSSYQIHQPRCFGVPLRWRHVRIQFYGLRAIVAFTQRMPADLMWRVRSMTCFIEGSSIEATREKMLQVLQAAANISPARRLQDLKLSVRVRLQVVLNGVRCQQAQIEGLIGLNFKLVLLPGCSLTQRSYIEALRTRLKEMSSAVPLAINLFACLPPEIWRNIYDELMPIGPPFNVQVRSVGSSNLLDDTRASGHQQVWRDVHSILQVSRQMSHEFRHALVQRLMREAEKARRQTRWPSFALIAFRSGQLQRRVWNIPDSANIPLNQVRMELGPLPRRLFAQSAEVHIVIFIQNSNFHNFAVDGGKLVDLVETLFFCQFITPTNPKVEVVRSPGLSDEYFTYTPNTTLRGLPIRLCFKGKMCHETLIRLDVLPVPAFGGDNLLQLMVYF